MVSGRGLDGLGSQGCRLEMDKARAGAGVENDQRFATSANPLLARCTKGTVNDAGRGSKMLSDDAPIRGDVRQ